MKCFTSNFLHCYRPVRNIVTITNRSVTCQAKMVERGNRQRNGTSSQTQAQGGSRGGEAGARTCVRGRRRPVLSQRHSRGRRRGDRQARPAWPRSASTAAFSSKDDLIVAYLEAAQCRILAAVGRGASRRIRRRSATLLLDAIMDLSRAPHARRPGYRGCPFINYAVEFPEASHPGHRVVEANKREWRRRLRGDRARRSARRSRSCSADSLLLLVEGAYAVSQTLGGPKGPGAAISAAAKAMVDGQTRN